jgi:hypothetical protein
LAVRFQNLVSFASAPVGSKAGIKIIKAVRLAISCSYRECCGAFFISREIFREIESRCIRE